MAKSEIIRIYICGPHSTGKTTLLNDLLPNMEGINVMDEVARGIIKSHGWKRDDFLPDKHPNIFQQLNEEILLKQIEVDKDNSEKGQDFICDRALDPIVYCNFYIGKKARDAVLQIPGMDNWLSSLRKSLIFLISPHKECISDDNVRLSSSIEELRQFYVMFEQELINCDIPFIRITVLGRYERVKIVLQEVHKFKSTREIS